MHLPSFLALSALMGTAGLTFVTVGALPASAYSVMLNGKTAGNPGSALYDVTLNSTYDVGRKLDPFYWYVPAGTTSDGNTTPIALSALLNVTVRSFTQNALTLFLELQNTTQVPTSDYRASILSFGFGASPNITNVAVNGSSVFDTATVQNGQQQFTGGFKQIDVCIFSDGCKGGDVKTGLQAGQSTSLELTLTGNFWDATQQTNFVTLSDFPLKFQTQNGSFEPAAIPEPMTIIGSAMALGFGALYNKQLSKKRQRLDQKR